MAELSRMSYRPTPDSVLIVGIGGVARQRKSYVNGTASDDPLLRNGAAVQRVSGMAVSIDGVGLDGATIDTSTPLGDVTAGTVFRAEGEVEVQIRRRSRRIQWWRSSRCARGVGVCRTVGARRLGGRSVAHGVGTRFKTGQRR